MAQHGHFYWNELMTRDPEDAKGFYGAIFGWQFEACPWRTAPTWCARTAISR